MTARVLEFSKPSHAMKMSLGTARHDWRENALSTLDYLELAFWIAFLVIVAFVVGVARSMRPKEKPMLDKTGPELVRDEDLDPFADLIGILP